MPNYNNSIHFYKSIESVVTQTYQCWELIIVDDCSTDSSIEIAQSYALKDKRIKVIKLKKNSGVAIARNTAIKAAKGRFIAFLDSDDIWYPEKLEKQINFMLKENVGFSYTAYEKIDQQGKLLNRVGIPKKVDYHTLLKTCVIGCLTVIYDAHKLGKIYMPIGIGREDFATWLYILKRIDYAHGISEVIGQYRVYTKQSSSNKIKMAIENWRLYRNVEKLRFIQACYYFLHYAIRGVLRTKYPRLARYLGVLD